MSIVVATDFSPCSRAAARIGAALARRRSAPLILVHAVESPAFDVPNLPIGATGWERDMIMAAEVGIAHDASDIRQDGTLVETSVLVGSPASVIAEVATDRRADLIIVGTHGRRPRAHLFLGSVAESVARSAACPVLVARDTAADLDRWAGTAPLRLVVGTDGSTASQAALSWASALAREQSLDLSIVRIYRPTDEAARYGLDDPWDGPRQDRELVRLLERDVRRDVEALVGRTPDRVRCRAAGRDAADALREEADSLGADAVVIGAPRHRARSTVLTPGSVLRSSALPVLCVPEAPAARRPQLKRVRSVLVATDLSEASNQVVSAAYGLLLAEGGRAELCTVHAVGAADVIGSLPIDSPLGDEDRAKLESRLRALIPPEAEASGIATKISVIEGRFAAEAIVAAAERLDVDLIAVASRGRSGFKRAVLGSVAEQVARHSSRPVLIVRSQPPT